MSIDPEKPKQAVALHYDGKNAPTVTARGSGALAEQIIALARANGVPVEEDAALLGLLTQLELNQEIPPALYHAVAEVIAFSYWLRDKVPEGWNGEQQRD